MSYSQIIVFSKNKARLGPEFSNSWGGAASIWDSLFDKYLKNPHDEYDSWIFPKNMQRLWDLCIDARLSKCERAIHLSTMDGATIVKDNFGRFVADLREFDRTYPKVNSSLGAWAAYVEECKSARIGFYQNSVAENFWIKYDDRTGRPIPYDLTKRNDHFELYQELEELEITNAK